MCVVSNIGTQYRDNFPGRWPGFYPVTDFNDADKIELAKLRKEVEDLKRLLEEADRFDKATGQVECQDLEKTKFIKTLADALGVKIECI